MQGIMAAWSSRERTALVIRIGLGLVFVVGGYNKLYQLLDPALDAALVESYMGTGGYINSFFAAYLFEGALDELLTPWEFLTAFSTFELVSGFALIAGLAVRFDNRHDELHGRLP